MKKFGIKAIAVSLLLVLMMTLSACGPAKLLIGDWKDTSGNIEYEFLKDGTVVATMYGFPLEVTYTLEGDQLTIAYSDELVETYTITFYGDDEFILEGEQEGEYYQEYYTRNTEN